MMTARIIVNTVKGICGAKGFVGHIGGDDFVFIVSVEKAEDSVILENDNIIIKIPFFTSQYLNSILQENGFLV